jgi:DNA-binding PadR family transcriptional regulator
VENDRLVSDSIIVICSISKEEKHVNAVIDETGLYKDFVHKAIKNLQKSGFIIETRTRSHKQKKIQKLTELGLETVKLMSDIEQFKRSHSEVKSLMVEKFGIEEDLAEIQIKHKLLSKRWNSEEIEFYHEFTRYALSFITESLNMLYNVLTYRYSSLLVKYKIKKSNTKAILNKILLNALEYHISNAGDNVTMRKLYHLKDNNEIARIMIERILSSIDTIEEHNPHLNRFTDREGKSLLRAICSVLEVPKNVIEDYLSAVKSDLKFLETDLFKEFLKEGQDTHFHEGSMVKNIYKHGKRKSQTKLSILGEMLKKSS